MPASFPSSIKSWTPVADNVDDVLAVHINDAYEEIIAIETRVQNTTGTNTGDQTLPVKATSAEADTATDDAKFLTSKAAKDAHNIPSVTPGTSGNVLTSDGTDWTSAASAGGADSEGVATLTSNFTGTSSSFADVTGLSFSVEANKTYIVEFFSNIGKATTNTTIALNGPASPTSVFALGSSSSSGIVAEAYDTSLGTVTVSNKIFMGDAVIMNGANAGTVDLRYKAVGGGTSTIYAGSTLRWRKVN